MTDTTGDDAATTLDFITPDTGYDGPASDGAGDAETDAAEGGETTDADDDLDAVLGGETGDKPTAPPADDLKDFEFNGTKYRIPAALEGGFMMQADYTRKTQEVATARRDLETQAAAIAQDRQAFVQQAELHQAHIQDVARLVTMDDQLAQYGQVDWTALEAEDPFRAQVAWREYQQLERTRNGLAGELQQKQAQAQQDHQRRLHDAQQASRGEIAKRAEDTLRVVREKIPGWNDTVASEVSSYARDVAGYTPEEIFNATGDPRAFVMLHKAMSYDRAIAKAAERAKARQTEPVVPLTQTQRGSASPAPSGLDDRLSADEWARRRNEQVRKRGR